jgi:hypothetical protein
LQLITAAAPETESAGKGLILQARKTVNLGVDYERSGKFRAAE